MVTKKFRKVDSTGDSNAAVIEVHISGGLPADDPTAVEAAQQVTKHVTADGRRVVIHGGLPDRLEGELMTPEQRKLHDDQHYAAAHGLGPKTETEPWNL